MLKKAAEKPSITGFFPFLNDWGTIGSLVATLDYSLSKISADYEIIIVDDGSDQQSKELLKRLQLRFPKLRVIVHKTNLGYGAAIKSGIAQAKMDWIFYTDGDAQYNPAEITSLVKKISPSVDVINGYKIKRNDPWFRIILGKTYHRFVKIFFNTPIRDTDCDFRLMRRTIFDRVTLVENSGLICAEMIKKIADAGYIFSEVPVKHYYRTSGKSQFFNIRRTFRMGWGLLELSRRLEWDKYRRLAYLHRTYLPESLLSKSGKLALTFFYFIFKRLNLINLVVYRERNKVIGFAAFLYPTNEIFAVAVEEKYQKKGLGTFLMKQLIRKLSREKRQTILVKCLRDKPAVNNFYLGNGFKLTRSGLWGGREFNYYRLTLSFLPLD